MTPIATNIGEGGVQLPGLPQWASLNWDALFHFRVLILTQLPTNISSG
jgi:hypothetical protein